MVEFIWSINSIALIFTIIIHNPKAQGMGGQNQLFTSTRSSEATLNKVTWFLIYSFFSLTTYLGIFNNIT